MPVRDGPLCPDCSLPNYEGLCSVCRGDEDATRREGLPYPFDDEPSGGDLVRKGMAELLARLPAATKVEFP